MQMSHPALMPFRDAAPSLRAADAATVDTAIVLSPYRGRPDGLGAMAASADETEAPGFLWRGLAFASVMGIAIWCLIFLAFRAIASAFLA